jgi:hypothetical protein
VEGDDSLSWSIELPEGTPLGTIYCEDFWEANIAEDGSVEIHDVNLDVHPESSASLCGSADDCPDHHWEGQIFESYVGPRTGLPHAFVNLIIGLQGPKSMTCEIDDSELRCEHVFFHAPQIEVEVHGELQIHADLELMHEST